MRAWIPAVAVAILMAAGLGLAAYLGLRYSTTATTPSPALSFDLHSKEAVVAAIRHYYEVEAKARETGNGSLIDAVTTGAGSLASQNFKAFIAAQAAANRRSVVVELTEVEEGSAYGAALLAGVSTGVFASAGEAVAACVRVRERIEPNETWARVYDEGYARFRALYPAAKSLEER